MAKLSNKLKGPAFCLFMAIAVSVPLVVIFSLVNIGYADPRFFPEVLKGCFIAIPIAWIVAVIVAKPIEFVVAMITKPEWRSI